MSKKRSKPRKAVVTNREPKVTRLTNPKWITAYNQDGQPAKVSTTVYRTVGEEADTSAVQILFEKFTESIENVSIDMPSFTKAFPNVTKLYVDTGVTVEEEPKDVKFEGRKPTEGLFTDVLDTVKSVYHGRTDPLLLFKFGGQIEDSTRPNTVRTCHACLRVVPDRKYCDQCGKALPLRWLD